MTRAASRYVHYLHGTNPLSLVYLTNMYAHGAENCANEMFHTWFADGSAMWDRAGTSTYGPPPGYLTGGPNPSYDWDGCCPSELRRRREQRDLHVAVDLAAEGAARAEVVQGLQHRLAPRLVERHRAERRLSGRLHPAALEVRAVAPGLGRSRFVTSSAGPRHPLESSAEASAGAAAPRPGAVRRGSQNMRGNKSAAPAVRAVHVRSVIPAPPFTARPHPPSRDSSRTQSPRNPGAVHSDNGTCAKSRSDGGSWACLSRWRARGAALARAPGENRAAAPRCPTARGRRSIPDIRCRSRSAPRAACRRFGHRGCSGRSGAPSRGRRSTGSG